MKPNRPTPFIELLESRIAPAGVITFTTDGKTATWTDVDGDKVTLKITKGQLSDSLFTTDQSPSTGLLVTQVNLVDPAFQGTGVSVSAVRNALQGGDNTVNIGYLNATGIALGKVSVNGDLGRIDAGDPILTPTTPKAIVSLTVQSMGMLDGETLPAGVIQTSEIIGKVGAVKVVGSIKGVLFNVTGNDAGSIDSLSIGGSLVGTDDADSGRISTSGKIGAIKINGNILGGAGQHSGSIEAGGAIASLKIGGSIFGGRSATPSTDGTGVVRSAASIGAVTIGGNIHGGTQQDSGLLSCAGNMGAVKILGGIIGGSAGASSGGVFVGGNLASISVKGDVLGGSALNSGVIEVGGNVGSITLLGSLTGGEGTGSGSIHAGSDVNDTAGTISIARDVTGGSGDDTGVVHVAGKLKGLTLKGSLHGASGEGSGSLNLDAGATTLTLSGDLEGGVGEDSGRINAMGVITTLTVGGNILGGQVDGSGSIISTSAVTKLTVGGSVIGGDLADTATEALTGSGLIQTASVGTLTVSGSIRVGQDYNATFDLVNNASIRVQHNIAKLVVKGGIEGTSETAAVITARGQAVIALNQGTDVAFGQIAIGGTVRHALVLAGYNTTADFTAAEANPNAQIGAVSVSGDWIASNLVAGVAWNDNFGDGTDTKSSGVDNPDINARIASIRVTGQVIGTAASSTDHFGFIAQVIGAMQTGKSKGVIQINAGAGNDNDPVSLRYNLASTLDVRVFEVA